MTHTSWLWPDHAISKRESRQLREEHNALLNSHAELLEALRGLLAEKAEILPEADAVDPVIAKAGG